MTGLKDAADLLDKGATALREFDEWVKADGFQTFGEFLLGLKVAEEEKPPIVTPPPKREAQDTRCKDHSAVRPCPFGCHGPYAEARPKPAPVFIYDPYKAATAAIAMLHEVLKVRELTHYYSDINQQHRWICKRCNESLVMERLWTIEVGALRDFPAHEYGERFAEWYRMHGPNCGRVEIERGEWRP